MDSSTDAFNFCKSSRPANSIVQKNNQRMLIPKLKTDQGLILSNLIVRNSHQCSDFNAADLQLKDYVLGYVIIRFLHQHMNKETIVCVGRERERDLKGFHLFPLISNQLTKQLFH